MTVTFIRETPSESPPSDHNSNPNFTLVAAKISPPKLDELPFNLKLPADFDLSQLSGLKIAELLALSGHNVKYAFPLSQKGNFGGAHLLEIDGEKITIKLASEDHISLGVYTHGIELDIQTLKAGLPCIPKLLGIISDQSGTELGVFTKYEGNLVSLPEALAKELLSKRDAYVMLKGFLQYCHSHDFYLLDTKAEDLLIRINDNGASIDALWTDAGSLAPTPAAANPRIFKLIVRDLLREANTIKNAGNT